MPASLVASRLVLASLALVAAACNSGPREKTTPPPRPAPSLVGEAAVPATGAAAQEASVSADAPAVERASSVEPLRSTAVAYVGGTALDVSDLLEHWLHRDSPMLGEMLETLVAARMAELEAQRLGILLDEALVDHETQLGLRLLEQELAESGAGVTLEEHVTRNLGLDYERFVERVRRDTLRQLLLERVVRAWTLSRPHAIARVIVVSSRERLESVQRELDAGEDFAHVARVYSIDPSSRRGGLTAPIVKVEQSPVTQLAFQAEFGEVVGPLEQMGSFMLMKVEERPEPISGNWAQIRSRVEQSLVDRPVEDSEFLQWKLIEERSLGVDRTPFLKLVREPLRPSRP